MQRVNKASHRIVVRLGFLLGPGIEVEQLDSTFQLLLKKGLANKQERVDTSFHRLLQTLLITEISMAGRPGEADVFYQTLFFNQAFKELGKVIFALWIDFVGLAP